MDDIDAVNFALLLARVWIAIMIFAHGWRHVKSIRSGPGMANWFESLGLKPGPLHAQLVTVTELVIPVGLVLGFLTPLMYAGVCALDARGVPHQPPEERVLPQQREEGYEYVVSIAVLSITLGTLGPGEWSLDDAADIVVPVRPEEGVARHRHRRHRRRGAVPPRVLAAARSKTDAGS